MDKNNFEKSSDTAGSLFGHGVERGIGTEGLQVQILHLNGGG